MTIEPTSIEDLLFVQLRTATVHRVRAALRGDDGLCILLERERVACLRQLGALDMSGTQRLFRAA